MPRARFSTGWGIRRDRKAQRGSGAGGSGGVSQTPPLPASAVEYWHSELACTPASWVGQLTGRTLLGENAPTVAADGSFFKGRAVAQTAITGTKAWALVGPAVLLAGSSPWIMCVARSRTTGANQHIIGGGSPGGFYHGIGMPGSGQLNGMWNQGTASPISISRGSSDTAAHVIKTWLDGVNGYLRVDANTFTAAYTQFLVADITNVAVGRAGTATVFYSDSSVAFVLVCSSKPTAAEEAALDAWAQAYWGTP